MRRRSVGVPPLEFGRIDLKDVEPKLDTDRAMSALMQLDFGAYAGMVKPEGYMIRKDLIGSFAEGENVETFTTGFLLDAIEGQFIAEDSPVSPLSTKWYMEFLAATRGYRVQPSFVVRDEFDNRIARRLWTSSDVKNVLDFAAFLRHYDLAAETAATLHRQEPILRGMMAYHLWLDANRRGGWKKSKGGATKLRGNPKTKSVFSDI